jgi:acyl transferase domain-containing protein/3-hydroxymyristoyl/3-hydroxydecanoyl-(acyl carrier protein) dehydratase
MTSKKHKAPYSIAITGIGGIFPGAASLDEFWQMIVEGRSAAKKVPLGRWPEEAEYYYGENYEADKVRTLNCCAIDKIPDNYQGLSLDKAQIEGFDPLYKIALQAGRDAFFDSKKDNLDLSRVQVILANIVLPTDSTSEITRRLNMSIIKSQLENKPLKTEDLFDSNPLNRLSAELPAGLLASALGLGGGGFTLDAACASSLYAIKYACDELCARRADAVLTGGVSRPSSQFTQMGFTQLRAISKTGICRPFDEKADGLIVGEGAGMFMLKRLEDAISAGDKIYGIIRGIGLANDVGGSLLAPYSEGQLRSMHAAYQQAGWHASDVQLFECHGTGTPTGDAVELKSIKELIGATYPKDYQCVVGSVKSNVGHLLTAAGAAGLMKLLFSLKHKTLPPTANFEVLDPTLGLETGPIKVLSKAQEWQEIKKGEPRKCALSAFGFGGIDGHVLIEEYVSDVQTQVEGHPVLRRNRLKPAVFSKNLSLRHNEKKQKHDDVAIIALETQVGAVKNANDFMKAALNGTSLKAPIPQNRHQVKLDVPWLQEGAYIDGLEITPGEFKISPLELPEILPQQLLMLKTVAGAIKNVISDTSSAKLDWGTFIGISQDFEASNFASRWGIKQDMKSFGIENAEETKLAELITPPLNHPRTVGALGGIVASRIAREYSIGGQSHTFSSSENSGLAALEVAVRALENREINVAIVGAVDLSGDLRHLLAMDKLNSYSRKGGSVPLEAEGDGAFPGEGAVALILKRRADALKDGDRILGVIRGIGKATAASAANLEAKVTACTQAMERAWLEADVSAADIGLLELSSNGNPELDGIELAAINKFIPEELERDQFKTDEQLCALASTKLIAGETGAAAGLLAFAKATMCINRQLIPSFKGLINAKKETKNWDRFFFTPNQPQYWFRNRIKGHRIAAINSIGQDGTFYHAVIEGFEDSELLSQKAIKADNQDCILPAGNPKEALFILEAEDVASLKDKLSALKETNEADIHSLASEYWLKNGFKNQSKVLSVVATSMIDLKNKLEMGIKHLTDNPAKPLSNIPATADKIFYNPSSIGKDGKIVFTFPGSGNHFFGMGTELGVDFSKHLKKLDAKYELLAAQFAPSKIIPRRLTYPANWEEQAMQDLLNDHNSLVFSHVSCCAFLSDLVRSFSIEPEIIMGYSLGETAGNFASGVWTERDEMVRRMRNSNLFTTELIGQYNSARKHWGLGETEKIEWALGLLACPASEVEKHLSDYDQVYILIENTKDECVIGGNKHQLDVLVGLLNAPFFPLYGVSSVHCPAAIPASKAYRDLHTYDSYNNDKMQYISSGKAELLTPERDASADSILAQCVGKIDFPKCVETAYEAGGRIFLEIGPQGSMTRMINSILSDKPHFARSLITKNKNETSGLIRFLASCAAEGISLNLDELYGLKARPSTNLLKPKMNPVEIIVGHKLNVKNSISARTAGFAKERTQAKAIEPEKTQEPAVITQPIHATKPVIAPVSTMNPLAAKPVVAQASGNTYVKAREMTTQFEQKTENLISNRQDIPSNALLGSWSDSSKANIEAHDAYLSLANQTTEMIARLLAGEIPVNKALAQELVQKNYAPIAPFQNKKERRAKKYPKPYEGPVFLDWKGSMEFAVGKIGNALGGFFAEIDKHPTRVRLPDIPLNFVDRIITVEGEKGSMGKGRVVTEHDVHPDTWYLDNDCMPTGMSVEAGQADLFLAAWLGIDFKTKGIAKYRLLDAVVTFHGPLARPGDTLHYDIRVDRFIRQADTYLFFFEYDGSINGQHLITMRNGCAGFFTDKQLAEGKGIVLTEEDLVQDPRPNLVGRENLPTMHRQAFDDNAIRLLQQCRFEEAFGAEFAGINIEAQTVPSGQMRMLDRITEIDPQGGRFGLGRIKAEFDIPKDPWFLTSHFCDDQVMPGTLMYESCMQSLRVFLLRLGWVAPADKCAFEPIIGVQSQLRCRGQVIPGVKQALYDIEIKELGYNPEPYAIADALMFADGNRIVQVLNMSIRLSGTNREEIEAMWRNRGTSKATQRQSLTQNVTLPVTQNVTLPVTQNSEMLPALYTGEQIYEYCIGKPSKCFGKEFEKYDQGKFLARLPNPPFLFVDRITKVAAEFLKIQTGGTVQGQFDIKPDHWFFRANHQTSIPFAVMLEFPLQVCGWYSCYMGSANSSEQALHYRNLDGKATLYEDININSGTLTATVKSTSAANSAGMLIQAFELLVTQGDRIIYKGTTNFGFFSKEALANQIGLRGAQPYEPTADEMKRSVAFELDMVEPMDPSDLTPVPLNGLQLPGKTFLMVDRIDAYVIDGGPHGLGYIRGTKTVDTTEWFFKAHFYQDPVIPGSLGLESFIQLLKIVAINRWGAQLKDVPCHFEPIAVGKEHEWSYRGQVIPTDKLITVSAVVTNIDDSDLTITGEGFLTVDGRIIYSMKNFTIRVKRD